MTDTEVVTEVGGVTAGVGSTAVPVPPPAGKKRARGREGAVDMVRSLAVVMLLVGGLWFFGQASPGDSQQVRRVDPTLELTNFVAAHPGVPVPLALPGSWTPNVASYDGSLLRVGYVLDRSGYAEFAAGQGTAFRAAQAGTEAQGSVDVGGVVWQRVRSRDGHDSLVRDVRGQTLVVGGPREKASAAQLEQLAAAVR